MINEKPMFHIRKKNYLLESNDGDVFFKILFHNTQLDGKIGSGYEKSDPSVSYISGMGTWAMGVPQGVGRKVFKVWLVICRFKGNEKYKPMGILIYGFN